MSYDFKIGDLGHLFVITSFIASIIAAFSYWRNTVLSQQLGDTHADTISWKKFARTSFYFHAASVIGVIAVLFYIIYNHRYDYYYAWDHSSNDLPVYYMISCFWEGQEGSFLLWIFWHVCIGIILINVNKTWEAPLMAVFCLVQAFLASMILGTVLPYIDFKIGSSPFILFKDQMADLPVYLKNPNYVPEDGSGLNALLQNYWMVIHPPTLFLGFALTIVPFAYCIAGLWQKKYKEWIRPSLPWALFGALVLGTGILMGGYWAYETLNFGGYWNWDPVENAVYIPWLVLVASIHTMISYKNSGTALKASMILVVSTFILILYSTFLTRSGVLGNASVHAFTDLGLSGQLLIYLLAFLILSILLMSIRWKEVPSTEKEASIYSREFWIFIGITVLCLAAFQVFAFTSIPVYNKLMEAFGIESNIAPTADPVIDYSNWQIWFSIFIALLSGIGQYFWWNKMDKEKLKTALSIPFIITLLTASVIIYFAEIKSIRYILLLTSSLFSIVANIFIFLNVVKSNYKLSGGAIAHIGIGMMLIGILFSSGYSKIISVNTGRKISKDETVNRENILLWRGEPNKMGDHTITYTGSYYEPENFPGYIKKEKLLVIDRFKAVALENIFHKNKIYFHRGDTVELSPENSFYEVIYTKADGDTFKLYPRIQENDQMGTVASPDIRRFLGKDLYTFVAMPSPKYEDKEWSPQEEHWAGLHDTLYLNDYVAYFDTVKQEKTFPGIPISDKGAVIKAEMRVMGKLGTYKPDLYMIFLNEHEGGGIPYVIEELGLEITLANFNDQNHKFLFTVRSSEKDYIILKAIEKPMINVLWIGTLLLIIGLFIAIVRRYTEFVKMRDKGVE